MSVRLAKRLVEPDHWTCPHGHRARPAESLTYGPEVADVCAKAGFEPDAQQQLGLDLIFAIRPDGSALSFEFCVICCRQNLKTGLFKQAALGWLFVTEQPLIVWSAHEMSTTNEARRELADLILGTPSLRKHLKAGQNDGIYDANGEERIELASGQRLLFKARTVSGGRGLAAPKLILDEAFALKASMLGSLLPLMTAQADPQVLYGSSAGKEDSDALFDLRERGRHAMSPRLSYLEWLAPKEDCGTPDCRHPKNAVDLGLDCALDREHLVRAANPSIETGRIDIETIRALRQAMPPAEFMRESLGWWDEPITLSQVIASAVWNPLAVNEDRPAPLDEIPPTALAVDMSHDRLISIAGCWDMVDRKHIELLAVDYAAETWAAVEWLIERAKPKRIPVVIDSISPAAEMVPTLKARKVKVIVTSAVDMGKACGGLREDAVEGRLTHAAQPQLDAALAGAKKRDIRDAGMWAWDRKDQTVNISPLVAVTLARYGAVLKPKTTAEPVFR
ncbi:hypothetical protein JGU71_28245 [Antrihabitans sp. YC3-6]|uniref:Terminase n=1 Tax=Antrihabitans stalagmiti TaxID=2799499 RepID=A0A934NX18_9NOCA|nr:hypothetical protein [Antrihabitans stalagmiti]MBJ8342787.1 hypothetical protein [Antrihabitans stalagmiti]